MPHKDIIGQRMKKNYEERFKYSLMRRTPVIIRIDGKAFHTFTKDFQKPFDIIFDNAMQNTLKKLCQEIQGCKFGYTQSDEISLLLIDYNKLKTSAWFDNEIQKICSVSASMATLYFNNYFSNAITIFEGHTLPQDYGWSLYQAHCKAEIKGAMFDARCFNIPKEEVTNYFYWRQMDAIKNGIQTIARCIFTEKELYKKSCDDITKMLIEKDINVNDWNINGICYDSNTNKLYSPPVFKGANRQRIEQYI